MRKALKVDSSKGVVHRFLSHCLKLQEAFQNRLVPGVAQRARLAPIPSTEQNLLWWSKDRLTPSPGWWLRVQTRASMHRLSLLLLRTRRLREHLNLLAFVRLIVYNLIN